MLRLRDDWIRFVIYHFIQKPEAAIVSIELSKDPSTSSRCGERTSMNSASFSHEPRRFPRDAVSRISYKARTNYRWLWWELPVSGHPVEQT